MEQNEDIKKQLCFYVYTQEYMMKLVQQIGGRMMNYLNKWCWNNWLDIWKERFGSLTHTKCQNKVQEDQRDVKSKMIIELQKTGWVNTYLSDQTLSWKTWYIGSTIKGKKTDRFSYVNMKKHVKIIILPTS